MLINKDNALDVLQSLRNFMYKNSGYAGYLATTLVVDEYFGLEKAVKITTIKEYKKVCGIEDQKNTNDHGMYYNEGFDAGWDAALNMMQAQLRTVTLTKGR